MVKLEWEFHLQSEYQIWEISEFYRISGIIHVAKYLKSFNTLKPRQNGRPFADDIFKCILLNENVWTSLKISLKFVPNVWINNIPALVQIWAWRQPGDKPLSEPMMVRLLTLTHINASLGLNELKVVDICFKFEPILCRSQPAKYRYLSARQQYLQCVRNGDTAVLH